MPPAVVVQQLPQLDLPQDKWLWKMDQANLRAPTDFVPELVQPARQPATTWATDITAHPILRPKL
jgi:hypothetical protein